MNVHERLDELAEIVHDARAMPMSASCIVNRGQVLDLIEDIREALPDELRDADRLLAEREQVVAEAHEEADRILAQARRGRGRRGLPGGGLPDRRGRVGGG